MGSWHRRTLTSALLAAMLVAGGAGHAGGAFPKVPDLILTVNQAGLAGATGMPAPGDPPWTLTDADLERLKASGVNTVRPPVYPRALGLDGDRLVWTNGRAFDAGQADAWPVADEGANG